MKPFTLAICAALFTALIWGFTLPLMKITLDVIPPFSLALARFFIASLICLLFVDFSRLTLRGFFQIAVISAFGITIHIGLLLSGLANTSSIDAAFILTLSPIVTSLAAVLAIRERIIFPHVLGIALAFSGSFLYISYPHFVAEKYLTIDIIADLLIFLAILSEAVYIIGSKKLFEVYDASLIAAVSFIVGVMTFSPLATYEIIQDSSWVSLVSWQNILAIFYLGIFSSFVAYLLLEWSLKRLPVHINGTIGYLSSIIAITISAVFLEEELNPFFLVSSILIIVGIALVIKFKPKTTHTFHHRHKV